MDLRDVITGKAGGQDQNLIHPTKVPSKERPAGFWKSIVIDALSVISAAAFSYLFYGYLRGTMPLWAMLAGLTAFGILSGLQAFLMKSTGRRFFVILLETLALVGFFYADEWRVVVVAGVGAFVFLYWGYVSARVLIGNSIEVPFFGASRAALGKFMTALLIFGLLMYVPSVGKDSVFISQQNFAVIFNWAAGLVNRFYPDLALSGPFSNFAESVVKTELADNQTFQKMTAQAQENAVKQGIDQFTLTFSKNLPAPVDPTKDTSDAFYGMFKGMVAAWQAQAGAWFAIGWALVLFGIFRSVAVIYVWVIELLLLIVYEILLASAFVRIVEESQPKEVISY